MKAKNIFTYSLLVLIAIVFLTPIFIILINSVKNNFYIFSIQVL